MVLEKSIGLRCDVLSERFKRSLVFPDSNNRNQLIKGNLETTAIGGNFHAAA
jgi:hypothetical protein